jgi:hypothetical protein
MPKVAALKPSQACRYPLVAWQELPDVPTSVIRRFPKDFKQDRQLRYFSDEPPANVKQYFKRLEVPCGHCMQCRLNHAREWSARMMGEASLSEKNCYVTFTYSPEHCPKNDQLVKRDFQLFMKRFRARFSGHQAIHSLSSPNGKHPIRYVMCGERGDQFERPHYHAAIFNFDPPDKKFQHKNQQGDAVYTSKILEELWGKGFITVGKLTSQSADYIARYVTKKFKGKPEDVKDYYRRIDPDTGEVVQIIPEYLAMSRYPGIGVPYFQKYHSDHYSGKIAVKKKDGNIIFRKLPRHFERLLKQTHPVLVQELKEAREEALEKRKLTHPEEFTEARLKVHDEIFSITRKIISRPDTPGHNDRIAQKLQRLQEHRDRNEAYIQAAAERFRNDKQTETSNYTIRT